MKKLDYNFSLYILNSIKKINLKKSNIWMHSYSKKEVKLNLHIQKVIRQFKIEKKHRFNNTYETNTYPSLKK